MRKKLFLAALVLFNIGLATPVSYQVQLEGGWNMFSPRISGVQESDIQQQCGDSLESGPWWYDVQSGDYVSSEALSPMKAYWIEVEDGSSCSLSFEGTQAGNTVQLSPGWNMISSSFDSFTLSDIRSVCGQGSVVGGEVWHWSPSEERYVSAQSIKPGKGYWVEMDSGCSFNSEVPDIPGQQEKDLDITAGADSGSSREYTFDLVAVKDMDTATVSINGDQRDVNQDDHLWEVSGVKYLHVERVVQTHADQSRGIVVLDYFVNGGIRTIEISNTGSGDSSSPAEVTWNGWELERQVMDGKEDSLETAAVDSKGNAVLDSGDTGYCGRAFFEKTIEVSGNTVDRLDIDYHVVADRWAGKAAVWVDGQESSSVDPSGDNGVDREGTWTVYLDTGQATVRVGIEDSSDPECSNVDHSLRLELKDVSISDTSIVS